MSVVVWIHEGCLSPYHPALQAYPGAPALFVFDEDYLRREGYTLKRIAFIYECLLDLPVTIRKGQTIAVLRSFAQDHGAERIVTSETVCPWHRHLIAAVAAETLPVPGLIQHPGPFDLTRFSRFWRKAEKFAYGR